MEKVRNTSYPLRMRRETREQAEIEAAKNRRSLNAELDLLIEEGLKWREMRGSR